MSKLLTQERLKELLDYDPITKVFRWRRDRYGRDMPGSVTGTAQKSSGRRRIWVDGKFYSPERLAHFYLHGEWIEMRGRLGRPTQTLLKRLFKYDPDTGEFTYLLTTNRTDRIGKVAGGICSKTGYRFLSVGGRQYPAHVLAFVYMKNEWPTVHVDHIDTCRDNNRWLNLRQATVSQNIANSRRRRDNTTGYKGVSRKYEKFQARIMVRGKAMFLGHFNTAREAHEAYVAAAIRHFGEYARAD